MSVSSASCMYAIQAALLIHGVPTLIYKNDQKMKKQLELVSNSAANFCKPDKTQQFENYLKTVSNLSIDMQARTQLFQYSIAIHFACYSLFENLPDASGSTLIWKNFKQFEMNDVMDDPTQVSC